MDNFILEIPNIASPELCEKIVEKVKNDPNKFNAPALVYSLGKQKLVVDPKRAGIMMEDEEEYAEFIKPMTKVFCDVYMKYLEHLETTFKDINKDADYNMNPFVRELESYKSVYVEGGCIVHEITKGRSYKWHHDFTYSDSDRFIAIIIYLNTLEEDEGGHTEFLGGRKVKPEIGKAVAYPRSWEFLHKGNEVLGDNAKYICTGHIRTIYHQY